MSVICLEKKTAAVATEDTAPAAALASSRANMPLKTIAGLTAEADMGAFTVNANAGVFNYNKNYNMLYGDRSKFAVGIAIAQKVRYCAR